MGTSVLILIILFILSGVFSASETALVSLSQAKVRDLVAKKKWGSKHVKKLKDKPQRLLNTILIGNNLVNIGASVYATIVFTDILGSSTIGIITGAMTLLILVFGEIVPKSFAQAYSRKLSLIIAPFIWFLTIIFFPLSFILEMMVKGLFKAFGLKKESVTEDEILAMTKVGMEEGAINRQEQEFIENILEFNDIKVESIMTPRKSMEVLATSTTVKDAAGYILQITHSRIPIHEGDIDKIKGFITVRDILEHSHREDFDKKIGDFECQKLIKVPHSRKINSLFHEFQNKRIHMAIVQDEHGGTIGLVTIEDLLEEIVGEIVDELDEEEDSITKLDRNTLEVNGNATIEDINDELNIEITDVAEHKTIAFLILEKLGRFPRAGEEVEVGPIRCQINDMNQNIIKKVTIEKLRR